MGIVNCTRRPPADGHNDEEDGGEHGFFQKRPSRIIGMAKYGLLALIVFVGLFQIGRFRGRRRDAVDTGLSASSPSLSTGEQHLRASKNTRGEKPPSISNSNNNNTIVHQAYFSSYLSHLSNLTTSYDPSTETPYFWDVHFSGESVAEYVFARCHGLVQACEFGLRQHDYDEDVSFCCVTFV